MRHLPLHTDGELKHQQRHNRPVSDPVTHGRERTPRAAMEEEARFCKKLSALQYALLPNSEFPERTA